MERAQFHGVTRSTPRFGRERYIVRGESPQLELARLQKEQAKTREDEVFGGLSAAERSAYDCKQARIRELERDLHGPGQRHQRKSASAPH